MQSNLFPVKRLAHKAWSDVSIMPFVQQKNLSVDQENLLIDEIGRLSSNITSALEMGQKQALMNYLEWLIRATSNRFLTIQDWSTVCDVLLSHVDHYLTELTGAPQPEIEALRKDINRHLQGGLQPMQVCAPKAPPLRDSNEFAQTLMSGDRTAVNDQIDNVVTEEGANYGLIASRLIQPAMYRIGDLWEIGQVSVAQEHMATALAQMALNNTLEHCELQLKKELCAVVSCVEGNHHVLGAQMVYDYLELQGWNTDFLGANCPTDALLKQIDYKKPQLVALSAALSSHLPSLKRTIQAIRSDFTVDRPYILVGGLVLNATGVSAQEINCDKIAESFDGVDEGW